MLATLDDGKPEFVVISSIALGVLERSEKILFSCVFSERLLMSSTFLLSFMCIVSASGPSSSTISFMSSTSFAPSLISLLVPLL
jgi:hypothetical protein